MATDAPTQTAKDAENSWTQRQLLARAIRVFVAVTPTLLSLGFGLYMRRVLPPDQLGLNIWLWLVMVLVGSVATVALAERVVRRLTPLTVLLKMSLIFPDQAPSRFKVAMRNGTTRGIQRRIDEIRETGEAIDDEAEYAEQMLALIAALSQHDRLTRGHCERVRAYTDMIIDEMGIPEEDANKLRWAALLHDVGKLMVPYEILNKEGRPSEEEWEVLKSHTWQGQQMVRPLRDWLGEWALAVGQHHERWDGGGYPLGLAGENIHLGGRIVAVADAYDVMTSTRSYKKPLPAHVARREIADCAGGQFDPEVARAFLNISLRKTRIATGFFAWLSSLPILQSGSAAAVFGAATSTAGGVVAAGAVVAGVAVGPDLPMFESSPDAPAAASAELEPPVEEVAAAPVVVSTTQPDGAALVDGLPDLPTGSATTTTAPAPTTTVPPTSTTPTTTTAPTTTAPAPPTTRAPVPPPTTAPPGYTVVYDDLAIAEDGSGVSVLESTDTAFLATITAQPAHGEAVVNVAALAGSSRRWELTYTPDPDFFGEDVIGVETCSELGVCGPLQILVDVAAVADSPDPTSDEVTIDDDGIATVNVALNDSDPDGDLTWTDIALTPQTPGGSWSADGSIVTFLPPENMTGTYVAQYEACDQTDRCVTSTVTVVVTVDDYRPTVVNDAATTVQDSSVVVDVLANDTDPEASLNMGAVSMVPLGAGEPDPGGAWTVTGAGIRFDPPAGSTGVFTRDYEACDDAGNCDVASITVTVDRGNTAPAIQGVNAQHGAVGATFDLQVNATDDDGDPVSFSASNLPAGLSMNTDGAVSGTVAAGQEGANFTVTVTADDGFEPSTLDFDILISDYAMSPQRSGLFITEVLYHSGAAVQQEAIELYNGSGSPIDLTGYRITDAGDGNLLLGGFDFVFPGTDLNARPSVLNPGIAAIVWIRDNPPMLPPPGYGALEFKVGSTSNELAEAGDDLWLFDDQDDLIDYVAWGSGADIRTAGPGPTFWDETGQAGLAGAAETQSISLALFDTFAPSAQCWEPTTSGSAAANCAGALTTVDADAGRIASLSWANVIP